MDFTYYSAISELIFARDASLLNMRCGTMTLFKNLLLNIHLDVYHDSFLLSGELAYAYSDKQSNH
jgi:hypothetical protein